MRHFAFSLSMILIAPSLQASEGACPKCVLIRKANAEKAKDQTWVFYEDWLETDEGKKEGKNTIEFEDDKKPSTEEKE